MLRRDLPRALVALVLGCSSAQNITVFAPEDVTDAADASDAAPSTDAPAADLPGLDAPPGADAATDGGTSGCRAHDDCRNHELGYRRCDPGSRRCVRCTPADDDCAPAQHCDGNTFQCVPGCRADLGCPGPEAPRCLVSAHRCVRCLEDAHCPDGEVCRDSLCARGCSASRPCASGGQCCAGQCRDTLRDPAHCGACDTVCAAAGGAATCAAGRCGITCATGRGDCDGVLANGCESDLRTTSAHCGRCANPCPAGGSCRDGACPSTMPCPAPRTLCGALCVSLPSDAMHCGACGNACPSGRVCSLGVCITPTRPPCSPAELAMSDGVCADGPATRACTDADLSGPLPARRVVFEHTGSDQRFTVPAGVTAVAVKLWGAGGGSWGTHSGGSGGAGAFAFAALAVTPGEDLTVLVGQGGGDGFRRMDIYGGGGHGGYFAGSGGGRSALRRGPRELVTAAGGGGGGSCNGTDPCGIGGAGGVSSGENGTDSVPNDATYGVSGTGATMMCGGVGGYTTCGCGIPRGAGEGGRPFQGGSTIGSAPGQGGGGGGGGYLGGASGGGDCGGNTGGGGGGGRSFAVPTEGCASAGTGPTPGRASDPDRGTTGAGAPPASGRAGSHGRVVLYY
ncbi:MAG: hypothetical protein HY909_19305 [Deltaproteobacteria bacterium]|nr:hypothetical protein [Deltaproteobacteria bacterium]